MMKAIYMNWRPGRDDKKAHEFNDINLLTMAASSLKMQEFGNDTKLYGDVFTYKYLEETGLMEVFDEVDGASLDRKIDKQCYDVNYFFNIGKFFAMLFEEEPSMLVDIDLIAWEDIGGRLSGKEAFFTHWETVRPANKWYCSKDKLRVPGGYKWNPQWDFRLRATNTSLMYFRDNDVKNHYCGQALKFMYKNFIGDTSGVRPEIYFVEQRLFLMCLKELGKLERAVPVIDTVWGTNKGAFVKKNKNQGWWDFFIPEPEQRITHTWIAKKAIESNREYRDYYCCRMLEEILRIKPKLQGNLEKMKIFTRYFQLLDKFETVRNMLDRGVVSNTLY